MLPGCGSGVTCHNLLLHSCCCCCAVGTDMGSSCCNCRTDSLYPGCSSPCGTDFPETNKLVHRAHAHLTPLLRCATGCASRASDYAPIHASAATAGAQGAQVMAVNITTTFQLSA